MNLSPPPLLLNFVPASRIPGPLSLGLGVAGAAAVLWTMFTLQQLGDVSDGLQLQLDHRRDAAARLLGARSLDPAAMTAAAAVAGELATPWSRMLADLEQAGGASGDDVALLSIEPDRKTHKVKLSAEARSLTAALAYVQKLQSLPAVRNALLESHAIQQDSPEHPVRVQITADWSQGI
jgi:hypothetical protein